MSKEKRITWGQVFGRKGEATLRQGIKDQDRKVKRAADRKARMDQKRKNKKGNRE